MPRCCEVLVSLLICPALQQTDQAQDTAGLTHSGMCSTWQGECVWSCIKCLMQVHAPGWQLLVVRICGDECQKKGTVRSLSAGMALLVMTPNLSRERMGSSAEQSSLDDPLMRLLQQKELLRDVTHLQINL